MIQLNEFNISSDTYSIPDDRHYDRKSHMWVQVDPAKPDVIVGIDALGLAALGDLAYVTLPPVGTSVQRGKMMGSLEAAKMTGGLTAPISGIIKACNEGVVRNPSMINQDAYTTGWLVTIQPSDWQNESAQLVAGEDLPAWVESELERYRQQGWID
jgi:glycine cleavage system H protein